MVKFVTGKETPQPKSNERNLYRNKKVIVKRIGGTRESYAEKTGTGERIQPLEASEIEGQVQAPQGRSGRQQEVVYLEPTKELLQPEINRGPDINISINSEITPEAQAYLQSQQPATGETEFPSEIERRNQEPARFTSTTTDFKDFGQKYGFYPADNTKVKIIDDNRTPYEIY